MDFKIADFQKGTRDSRSLFTRNTLKGGPVEARTIVDAFINSNRALFGIQQNMKLDMEAGEVLGLDEDQMQESFQRVGSKTYESLNEGVFRPFLPSPEVQQAFEINAEKLGLESPYEEAADVIENIYDELTDLDLNEGIFPDIANPLMPIMQDTPITPTTLNLPSIDANAVNAQVQKNIRPDLTRQQLFDFLFPQG